MTPAARSSGVAQEFASPASEAPFPLEQAPVTRELEPATVMTLDGRFVTGGLAEIARDGACWTATLKHLDRPGLVASMYFGEGLRNVVFRLHDGRSAKARIAGTSFLANSQRICTLTGIEPLS